MSSHAHVPPSELVIEPPLDLLHRRALVVAACLRQQQPDAALGQRLPLQIRPFVGIPARVAIDQRHVAQLAATGPEGADGQARLPAGDGRHRPQNVAGNLLHAAR